MKFFVYRNLNRRGWVWSIKAVDGKYDGLVVGHANGLLMSNPYFHVSEAGRQRVLRQLKKNVHAGVVGEIIDTHRFVARDGRDANVPTTNSSWMEPRIRTDFVDVTYNPYKYTSFIERNNLTPITTAETLSIWYDEVRALNPH